MSNRLIQLPDFSYTSLDFDTIINDVKALVRENPEYYNEWDDFLESNAGRLFVEITSFIVEKLSARVDWNIKEMFVSTATQRQSLINILKLINHKPELPKASKVLLDLKLTKWVEPFPLGQREQVLGRDTSGNTIRFECLNLLADGKPDYEYIQNIQTLSGEEKVYNFSNVSFYAGSTVSENDIWMEGLDNEKVILNRSPVIEDSVRIYSEANGKEFIEVDSFISPEAQQNDVDDSDKTIPYLIEIDASNKAIIKFGPRNLVDIPTKGERIVAIYRVGGGAKSNVVANSINTTKSYNVKGERTSIIFTNPDPATGGEDEESLEDAKLTAPLSLRSANKTVTNEDYVSHLTDLQFILKVSIIGKENEPTDIYEDYGYFLPSLETWIYVAPRRLNWETTSPKFYNKTMLIVRPYDRHDWIDYEDIEISGNAAVNLKKYRKYEGYTLYITLFEETSEGIDWAATDSFIKGIDYEIDEARSEFIKISEGNIPSGDRTLRILYIYDSTWENHKVYTSFTFFTDTVELDSPLHKIYPGYGVTVQSKDLQTTYTEETDYEINYSNNSLSIIPEGSLNVGDKVIIRFASDWVQGDLDASEENDILSAIKNKKMICIDNLIKDSKFGTFDIVATIYCYKNMRAAVELNLENNIRSLYTLKKGEFWENIRREEIAANIFNFEGVRYAEITYLGRDYVAYRKESLSLINEATLLEMGGLNVEHKIECRYNEILVLADDEWESEVHIVENKRHGLIFKYQDAT